MKKRDFIQHASISMMLHPKVDTDPVKAVKWSLLLWQRLTEAGYGDTQKAGTEHSRKDWYKMLSPYQREWFDKFWTAFSYKSGRNEAAMVWHKLGELTKPEYEHIVAAAKLEASGRPEKVAAGTSPIMAQGWLSKRRFDDVPAEKVKSSNDAARSEKVRELLSDMAAFKQRADMGDEFAKKEVKRIAEKLKELQGGNHG